MTLTEGQKHLVEVGVLVGAVGIAWYLLHNGGSGAESYTPQLSYGGNSGITNPNTLNYPGGANVVDVPGVGPISAGPPATSDPFNLNSPVTTNVGGAVVNLGSPGNCGCCSAPPADGGAFPTPQAAVATIAAVNPYGFVLNGIPGGAAETTTGVIIPGGASSLSPGSIVPVSQLYNYFGIEQTRTNLYNL